MSIHWDPLSFACRGSKVYHHCPSTATLQSTQSDSFTASSSNILSHKTQDQPSSLSSVYSQPGYHQHHPSLVSQAYPSPAMTPLPSLEIDVSTGKLPLLPTLSHSPTELLSPRFSASSSSSFSSTTSTTNPSSSRSAQLHPPAGSSKREMEIVKWDPVSRSFHHPATTPPSPFTSDKKELEQLYHQLMHTDNAKSRKLTRKGRTVRKSSFTGPQGGVQKFSTNFKIDVSKKRVTKGEKTQGRPFGHDSCLVIKLVANVKDLYRCASYGRDKDKVMHTAVIYTDNLSSFAVNNSALKRASKYASRHGSKGNWPSPDDCKVVCEDNIPLYVYKSVADHTEKKKKGVSRNSVQERVWHYTRIAEAIEYNFKQFGISEDNFTYYEIVRASSSLKSDARALTGNKKVLKIIARPHPPKHLHDIVHVKANVCYPRYKMMMNMFITPGATKFPHAYYTSDTLWDQEELLGFDHQDTIYCGPELLGIEEKPPQTDRILSKLLLLHNSDAMEMWKEHMADMSRTKAAKSSKMSQTYYNHTTEVQKRNLQLYREMVYKFQGISLYDDMKEVVVKTRSGSISSEYSYSYSSEPRSPTESIQSSSPHIEELDDSEPKPKIAQLQLDNNGTLATADPTFKDTDVANMLMSLSQSRSRSFS